MAIEEVYESVRQKMRLGQLGAPKHKKMLEFLKTLWNEEEIQLLDQFDGAFKFMSARNLAKKSGMDKDKVKTILKGCAKRGTIFRVGNDYALLTLAPGLFENYILTRGDTEENTKKVAEFFWWAFENLFPQMYNSMNPPVWRPKLPYDAVEKLIIIDEAIPVKDQQILPGELVLDMIEKNDCFAKLYCQCRMTGKLVGQPCKIPEELGCFLCGLTAKMAIKAGLATELSKEEAIQYIKDCEKAGLVHMGISSQGPETNTFICNCCNCHCLGLSGMAKLGIADYGRSNFVPEILPELCVKCESCLKKCPMNAIIHQYPLGAQQTEERIIIKTQKCIGCGVCAANCSKNAIKLVKRRAEGPPIELKLGEKSVRELLAP
jgi:NAD-dependent dihydropyrimidine dehydrogenase PreA subunit